MKVNHAEGTWFAIPLRNGGFAVGLVARATAEGPHVLACFFGPKRSSISTMTEVADLRAAAAVKVARIGDLRAQSSWCSPSFWADGAGRRNGGMGLTLLGDVLSSWERYALDDSVYVPVGAILAVDLLVSVLPADPDGGRSFEEQEYFLGLEQIRDVVEGLEAQLGRKAKQTERLRAAVHYARHDAFIDPREASGSTSS